MSDIAWYLIVSLFETIYLNSVGCGHTRAAPVKFIRCRNSFISFLFSRNLPVDFLHKNLPIVKIS